MRAWLPALCLLVVVSPAAAQTRTALILPAGVPCPHAGTSADEAVLVRAAADSPDVHVPAAERAGLGDALAAAYTALPDGPSVWLSSVTRPQRADGFDALLFEPATPSDVGVVFLHGYGGAFTQPCASVAAAVAPLGARTLCPALSRDGHWADAEGPAIVARSLDALRARGATRIVLVGLSNGAVAASRLAERLRARLSGVVLLSGAARSAHTSLPALVVQGTHDTMTPPSLARAFARSSPHASLHELDGDHFLFLHRERDVQSLVRDFVASRAAAGALASGVAASPRGGGAP